MLCLPFGDSEGNKVFSSYTLHEEYNKTVEPAGKFFEEYANKKLYSHSLLDDFINSNGNEDIIIEEDEVEYEWEKDYKEKLRSTETSGYTFSGKDNFYAILGIDDLFLSATVDDVRKAYKKLALIYHPDKNKENIGLEDTESEASNNLNLNDTQQVDVSKLSDEEKKKMEINKRWLKIKEAYETLLDPEKKKKFDSTFEFDDTIPEENKKVDEKTFFYEYGPVFLKNGIWSKESLFQS